MYQRPIEVDKTRFEPAIKIGILYASVYPCAAQGLFYPIYLPPMFLWRGCYEQNQMRLMSVEATEERKVLYAVGTKRRHCSSVDV